MSSSFNEIIKIIFDTAVDLPEEEREKYFNSLTEEEKVYLEEVRSLIKSYHTGSGFLDTPEITALFPSDVEIDENPLVGQHIGQYKIEEEIGYGGMGVVYVGRRDDKQFTHKVAIKVLKQGLTSGYFVKRFENERQILANLQHPNIAKLFDGGRTEADLPYLVMEFIEGIPITEYCYNKKLNIEERLKLFLKVCSAVQYAHQNLIIHRDLKPGNILVNQHGEPKLLDFGIAKLLDESTPDLHTRMIHLTPEFASPEQIKGENITTSSDIYSLGVLLYHLLTENSPYNLESRSPIAILKKFEDEKVSKPSDLVRRNTQKKTLKGLSNKNVVKEKPAINVKQLQGDLDNIVLKAMHKDPAQRYVSVKDLQDDLNRFLKGLPVAARKDTISYRVTKFVKRHKVGVAVFIVVNLLIFASIIAIIYQGNVAAKERDKAELELQKFEEINNFLLEMLASPDPSAEGKDIRVYDLLEKATEDADIKLRNYPKIKAAIKQTLGSTFIGLGDYTKAEKLLLDAHNFNKKTFGYISEETAKTSHQLGLCYDWIGNAEKSDSFYLEGIKIYKQLPGPPPKGLADNMNDYASMLTNLGEFDSSEVMLKRALEIYELHGLGSGQKAAVSINNLAVNMHHQWKIDDAEKYYIQAKNILTDLYGENRPEIGSIYNNLAFIYLDNKKYEQSEQAFIKSYEIKKAVYDKFHPYVGLALINLGMLYFITEDYQKAEIPLIDAKEVYIKNNSLKDPFLALGQYWLGRVYLEWGKLSKAETEFRKSLKLREEILPENNFKIWSVKGELGVCLLRQNRLKEAEKFLISSLEFFKEENRDKTKIKSYTENAAILYNKLGNKKLAAEYSREFEIIKNESMEE